MTFRSTNAGNDTPTGAVLSRGLGWFSVGMGLAELTVPKTLARTIGLDADGITSVGLRLVGLRSLLNGAGILLRPRRPVPMWSRVAGDVLDLALLGWAASAKRTSTQRLAATFVGLAATTALDVFASRRVTRAHEAAAEPVIFSVTINKPPAEVYAYWRKLENLPLFMDYLESVRDIGGGRSHWVAKLPVGGTIEWEADITEDRPGEVIAWHSAEGSKLEHRGKVTFARTPGRNATEVRVELEAGVAGFAPTATLAKLLTKPQIKGDLRRFKQVMETGEVLFSDASIHKGPHPAKPSAELPAKKGLQS